jgi:hypothetical protein
MIKPTLTPRQRSFLRRFDSAVGISTGIKMDRRTPQSLLQRGLIKVTDLSEVTGSRYVLTDADREARSEIDPADVGRSG